MGNKEINKAIPVELADDALDTVSGGTEPSQNEEFMPIDPSNQYIEFQIYAEYIEEAEKRSN